MDKIQVIETQGIRVLTTKQIAELYETKEDIVKHNFGRNKAKYKEGKHYIALTGDELRQFKSNDWVTKSHLVGNRTSCLYLWTEKGALLHAKSINTDKAWEVYDYLVDYYFRQQSSEQPQQIQKSLQVSKPLTAAVVDIPVNAQAQNILQELKKDIAGMEAILPLCDRYIPEEDYNKLIYVVKQLAFKIGDTAFNLGALKPKLIEKVL